MISAERINAITRNLQLVLEEETDIHVMFIIFDKDSISITGQKEIVQHSIAVLEAALELELTKSQHLTGFIQFGQDSSLVEN